MTLTYGFYNSLGGDRVYDAIQLSSIFDGIIEDGIFEDFGGAFQVTTHAGMFVNVASGRAWFDHTWNYNDATVVLAVDAAEVALNRIDIVVLDVNTGTESRTNALMIVKGTPGTVPVAPTLVSTSTHKQYALAHLYIGSGVTTISTPNITDKRGLPATPWVLSVIESSALAAAIVDLEADIALVQSDVDGNESQSRASWFPLGSTMTYSSVDSPTGVVTINADMKDILSVGMRLRYEQSHALTGYWNFDAGSSVANVGSQNGSDTGMTYAAGKFSNAAVFNGTTSKIVFADNAIFKPTTAWTIGLWMKTATTGATPILFQSYSANTARAGIQISITANNVIRVRIGKNTGTVADVDSIDLIAVTNVCDNANHYIVVTFKNNYLQIYIDGVLEAERYSFAPVYAGTNYVRFGCQNVTGTDAAFYTGQIDDLFIMSYALSEQMIKAKFIANEAQSSGTITVTKYAIITKVGVYSGGNTTVTFYSGIDSELVSGTITNPYFSSAKAPLGFPTSPNKWTVFLDDYSDQSQPTPTNNTFYNLGSLQISAPIGQWTVEYSCIADMTTNAAGSNMTVTLSTSTTVETDDDLTAFGFLGTGTTIFRIPITKIKRCLNILTKVTYYLIMKSASSVASVITFRGTASKTRIRLVSAYL